MFSRHDRSIRRGGSERRGSVLVLVIAVLAMLFVIGATQLMVARSERKTAEERSLKSDARDVAAGAAVPAGASSTEDISGLNALAYDGGWNYQETSLLSDAADFTGVATTGTAAQQIVRSGDLLTASLEPYKDVEVWKHYFMSWSKDSLPGKDTNGDGIADAIIETPGSINIGSNALPYVGNDLVGRTPVNTYYRDQGTNRLCADADGDGIVDARWVGSMSGCDVYQRVISHGGMVNLDRMTHPALLSQVIHPSDSAYYAQPWTLFSLWSGASKEEVRAQDEARLRRRFSLAGSTVYNSRDWQSLPQSGTEWDLRVLLPFTLGYRPENSVYASHYWRIGSPPPEAVERGVTVAKDYEWWEQRMSPELNGGANYDRQHLLTTHSSDDVLRPIRDEDAILRNRAGTPPAYTYTANTIWNPFYYVLNPTDQAGADTTYGLDTWARVNGMPVAYGVSQRSGALEFNKAGMRTPFSLRDVLVAPSTTEQSAGVGGYQASYRRAMQLTAYYLAMLQHQVNTNTIPAGVPGSVDQGAVLRQAAQLAVNTIDFADNNDVNLNGVQNPNEVDPPTRLKFTFGGIDVDVYGFEKQPFITEVYAKVAEVYDQGIGPFTKNPDPAVSDAQSVFAVELYNPYQTSIDLTGLVLRTNDQDYYLADAASAAPGRSNNTFMAAGEVLIFANVLQDLTATSGVPNLPFDNKHKHVILTNTTTSGSTVPLKILAGHPVQLIQTRCIRLDPPDNTHFNGVSVLETGLPTAGTNAVVLDQIDITDAGTYALFDSQDPAVTGRVTANTLSLSAADFAKPLNLTSVTTAGTYWRHTSLQRRKEPTPARPAYWHFTIGKQAGFESAKVLSSTDTAADQAPVHGLYVDANTAWGYLKENDLAQDGGGGAALTAGTALTALRFQYIAPVAFVTSDRGLDQTTMNLASTPPYVGTAAFPTTGSLLLVTSQGPTSYNGTVAACLPVQAAKEFTISPTDLANANVLTAYAYGKGINVGHMPAFDVRQNLAIADPAQAFLMVGTTSDLGEAQGRLDVPWGQNVFAYFTALPLEELTSIRYAAATSVTQFENLYIQDFGAVTGSGASTKYLFSYSPFVEPVVNANARFGARVRGRININYAPWWVMDGLPALRGDYVPMTTEKPVSGLPVKELISGTTVNCLDPVLDATTTAAGAALSNLLIDPTANPAVVLDRTISSAWAHYLVAYREKRPVDGYSLSYPDNPGFTTPGAVCDVVARIPIKANYAGQPMGGGATGPVQGIPYILLRAYADPTIPAASQTAATLRPFSYVGYLQMIAPVVRLEDWATVKSHVYTVYNLVGDGNGTWLRSQTTLDRTRCLYTNDLPDRITQTEPIDYFNTVGDQQ